MIEAVFWEPFTLTLGGFVIVATLLYRSAVAELRRSNRAWVQAMSRLELTEVAGREVPVEEFSPLRGHLGGFEVEAEAAWAGRNATRIQVELRVHVPGLSPDLLIRRASSLEFMVAPIGWELLETGDGYFDHRVKLYAVNLAVDVRWLSAPVRETWVEALDRAAAMDLELFVREGSVRGAISLEHSELPGAVAPALSLLLELTRRTFGQPVAGHDK